MFRAREVNPEEYGRRSPNRQPLHPGDHHQLNQLEGSFPRQSPRRLPRQPPRQPNNLQFRPRELGPFARSPRDEHFYPDRQQPRVPTRFAEKDYGAERRAQRRNNYRGMRKINYRDPSRPDYFPPAHRKSFYEEQREREFVEQDIISTATQHYPEQFPTASDYPEKFSPQGSRPIKDQYGFLPDDYKPYKEAERRRNQVSEALSPSDLGASILERQKRRYYEHEQYKQQEFNTTKERERIFNQKFPSKDNKLNPEAPVFQPRLNSSESKSKPNPANIVPPTRHTFPDTFQKASVDNLQRIERRDPAKQSAAANFSKSNEFPNSNRTDLKFSKDLFIDEYIQQQKITKFSKESVNNIAYPRDNLTEQQALDFLRLQQEKREKAADKSLSDSEDSSSSSRDSLNRSTVTPIPTRHLRAQQSTAEKGKQSSSQATLIPREHSFPRRGRGRSKLMKMKLPRRGRGRVGVQAHNIRKEENQQLHFGEEKFSTFRRGRSGQLRGRGRMRGRSALQSIDRADLMVGKEPKHYTYGHRQRVPTKSDSESSDIDDSSDDIVTKQRQRQAPKLRVQRNRLFQHAFGNIARRRSTHQSTESSRDSGKTRHSKYAYVTLVMLGDVYVKGALVLAHSLKLSATKYDLVCMVTSDVSNNAVEALSVLYRVIRVQKLHGECCPMNSQKQREKYPWINFSFTKWNCYTFTEYKKVFFLDADVVVTQNIDSIFEESAPAGMFVSPWADQESSSVQNFYGKLKHRAKIPWKTIRLSLENRGFVCPATSVLIEPNVKKHLLLLEKLVESKTVPFGFHGCWSGHDEQMLMLLEENKEWTYIDYRFGFIPWHVKPMKNLGSPTVLHFFGNNVWDMNARQVEEWVDARLWWSLARNLAVTHPRMTSCFSRKQLAILEKRFPESCFWCKSQGKEWSHQFFDPQKGRITCPFYL